MNQKKQKREKAKLIDHAEIVIETSKLAVTDSDKIEFFIKAALILKKHPCEERTYLFKEAIELTKKLDRHKMMLNLAVVGLQVMNEPEDIEFYQDTIKEYYKTKEINSVKDEST